jgi:hypothetical protein
LWRRRAFASLAGMLRCAREDGQVAVSYAGLLAAFGALFVSRHGLCVRLNGGH